MSSEHAVRENPAVRDKSATINPRKPGLLQHFVPLIIRDKGLKDTAFIMTSPPIRERIEDESNTSVLAVWNFNDNQSTTGLRQRSNVCQSLLEPGGGMEHVRSNDQVARAGLELWLARMTANIERTEIHLDCVSLKILGSLLEKRYSKYR